MLYEFILQMDQDRLNEEMEKLTAAGLVNLYYEEPIEIEKVQNGYSYRHLEKQVVDLKIYGDEEEEQGLPDSFLTRISKTVGISEHQIPYRKIDDNWSFELEDIDLGGGWIIHYSEDEPASDQKVLRFNPQAAFGTGLHETTQDCLKIILERDFTGKQVLDLGTGSGILTVAASLKKAEKVIAIDYEQTEREVLHNVELNKLDNQVLALQEDLINGDYLIKESFDWIFINIGADETVEILNKHQLLNKSDNFLISGLVDWNVDKVWEVFHASGFQVEKKLQSNEWVSVYFKKQ